MPTEAVLILTTVGAAHDARALARSLVDARLSACVNIIDHVQSVYRWEGSVQEDGEQLLLIKTTPARVDELRAELFRVHPYEVPEFVVLPIEALSDAYSAWLRDSVGS